LLPTVGQVHDERADRPLHRALYHPGSLALILAPAEREAKEPFSKVAEMYATLGKRVASDSYRKLGMEI